MRSNLCVLLLLAGSVTTVGAADQETVLTISGPIRGDVVADTVRLPAIVEVTADTTIIADRVEFSSRHVRIATHGHDFTFAPKRTMGTNAVITIDTSGTPGSGSSIGGSVGFDGFDGEAGASGYIDPNSCAGDKHGKTGGAGQNGDPGGAGGTGGDGGPAGAIVLDIPDGSQDSYVLIARGGQGGGGGPGGPGGRGGTGGPGGNGGYMYMYCGDGIGGNGGQGGKGGNSGTGGTGGTGGPGGRGGNVNISYPPGYDRSRVSKDLRGGDGGAGGPAGFSGIPGSGGDGGQAGGGDAGSGSPGSPGNGGIAPQGSPGNSGSSGAAGQETTNPMTTVRTDKPVYFAGDTPVYTVTGPPNSPILWSSTKNGAPSGEADAFYGQHTNAQGRFTGPGGGPGNPWQETDLGNWTKQVKVAGETASVSFEVRASGPWAEWSPLGGGLSESIAAVPYGVSSEELFAFGRGFDNGLYVNRRGGQFFTGWQGLGGSITSKPVAVNPMLTPYVFARGADGSVVYRVWNGTGFGGWRGLGGYIQGSPAAVVVVPPATPTTQPPPYVMVFARGSDNGLYVNRQPLFSDEFSGWQGLGGQLTSDPAAVSQPGGGAQVFARNTGGGIDTIGWTSSAWTGWQNLGGAVQGNPTAATATSHNPNTQHNMFVLARGNDDALQVNRFNGSSWSGWQSLGGVLRSDPVATSAFRSQVQGAVYVAVRGTDDGLHVNRWLRPDGWRGWSGIGGATALAPGLTSRNAGPAEAFGVGIANGAGYHRQVY